MSRTDQSNMITLFNVNKWYAGFHALKDISLNVTKGERIVVCGPSGSGKSTMIRSPLVTFRLMSLSA